MYGRIARFRASQPDIVLGLNVAVNRPLLVELGKHASVTEIASILY